MTNFRMSKSGILLLKLSESVHDGDLSKKGLQPEMCPAGVWTEGFGHTILVNGRMIKGLKNKALAYKCSKVKTLDDALKLLAIDLKPREDLINSLDLKINQNQFDPLVDFVYNLGSGNFLNSTLLRLIKKDPNDFMIAYEFPKWRKAGGRVLTGLVVRRHREASLYFTGRFN